MKCFGLESNKVFSFWMKRILFCFTTCLSSEGLRTILIEEHDTETDKLWGLLQML